MEALGVVADGLVKFASALLVKGITVDGNTLVLLLMVYLNLPVANASLAESVLWVNSTLAL